jgi:uncharacterized protein (TIGR03435 family)
MVDERRPSVIRISQRRSTNTDSLTGRTGANLKPAKKTALGGAGTVSLAVAIIIAMLNGPTRALAQGSGESTPVAPVATPRFDVASVRLCKDAVPFEARTGGGISSPGTLDINCQTLKGLIQMAYVAFASGVRVTPDRIEVEGGPKWIDSERYNIKAKAEGVSSQVIMHGPMLQALLEDRFQVRVHHETRKVPVYILSIAKGGPKLQPFKEGTCNPYDIAATFPPPPPPENPCRVRSSMNQGVLTVDTEGTTLDEFARFTLGVMDRPVIDRTGIRGRFNLHLEYTPDQASSAGRPVAPAIAEQSGPSIFRAVQRLGLKLEPGKGPGDYLVIDRAEKPSEN